MPPQGAELRFAGSRAGLERGQWLSGKTTDAVRWLFSKSESPYKCRERPLSMNHFPDKRSGSVFCFAAISFISKYIHVVKGRSFIFLCGIQESPLACEALGTVRVSWNAFAAFVGVRKMEQT